MGLTIMQRGTLLILVLTLTAPAAFGQIANPTLSLPPCIGPHCLVRQPGSTAPHAAAPSFRKRSCPPGTVFDAYKGDCRVARIEA